MVKSKYLIILSAALVLAACGTKNDASSSSTNNKTSETSEPSVLSIESKGDSSEASVESSSEAPLDGISFNEFAKIITNAAYTEAKSSSGGTFKSIDVAGSITDTVEYDLTVFNDLSSYATGTVVEKGSSTGNTITDSFIDRRAIKVTKVEDAGVVYDDEMLYTVKDYKNDTFVKTKFQDSSSRIFVTNNAGDDVDESLYLNVTEAKWSLTLKATDEIINFFDANFYSNIYVEQLGVNRVHEEFENDLYTYTVSAEYQLDGDLNDTRTYKYSLEVVMNSKKDRVLSYKSFISDDDVSKMNPSDRYLSTTLTEVTVKYETREDAAPTDVPDVFDYYLHKIDKVKVVDYKGDEFEDLNMISPSNNFLFIEPVEYSPATAMGVTKYTITPLDSTNKSAVKVGGATSSNPYFEIVGGGETTLTYAYFGMDESTGVFKNILGTVDVRISDTLKPTRVYIGTAWSNGEPVSLSEFQVGKEYTMDINVYSQSVMANVNQSVTINCSDSEGLSYSLSESNKLTINPQKAGTYTIIVTSVEEPTVYETITITVADNTAVDLASVLINNTWELKYIHFETLQHTNTVTFAKDGTGTMKQVIASSGAIYTDTFTWKLDGVDFTASDWKDYPSGADYGWFTKGVIGTELDTIVVTGKNGGTYTYAIKL